VDTYATVKIYDINLELVRTVVDGIFRRGGVESDDLLWDGANGDGDLAANGVYFYRIQLDSGEDLWGKVVLIK
jgi:flagellar hook assembly protein FlgD